MARDSEAQLRRSEISRIVLQRGFVRIDGLADHFGVTPMTIHRDVDQLNERGVVKKVRTGVRAIPVEERERNVAFRSHHMHAEKAAIARAAVEWVGRQPKVGSIALDDSTTVSETVDGLLASNSLTILTNFRPTIDRIADHPDSRLIAIGGTYSHEFQSFQGPQAIEAIRSVQVDVAMISATAVRRSAVYHPSEGPLLVKRAMLSVAANRLLLVDHTKFDRRALHKQADLSEFDVAIVDDGIEEDDLDMLRDHVESVVVAQPDEQDSPAGVHRRESA